MIGLNLLYTIMYHEGAGNHENVLYKYLQSSQFGTIVLWSIQARVYHKNLSF